MPQATLGSLTALSSVQISDAGHTNADHGVSAISKDGHIATVYQHGTTNKDTVLRIRRYLGNGRWTNASGDLTTIGDAGTSLFASETCQKPWIAALGDGSFVAVYHRKNAATGNATRVEIARATLTGSTWAIDVASAGVGHTVDATVTAGDADVMPRMAWISGNIFVLLYSHQASRDVSGAVNTRTYDLRGKIYNWSATGAPTELNTGTVVSAIPFDDSDTLNFASGSAGLIIAYPLVDNEFNIVCAYEEWDSARASSGEGGRIVLKTVGGPYHATPLTVLATDYYEGSDDRPLRRPVLAKAHPFYDNGANEFIITYGDQYPAAASASNSTGVLGRFAVSSTGSISKLRVPIWPARATVNQGNLAIESESKSSAFVMQGYAIAAAEATWVRGGGSNTKCFLAVDPVTGAFELFQPATATDPARPHFTGGVLPDGRRVLVMTYEDATTSKVYQTVFAV